MEDYRMKQLLEEQLKYDKAKARKADHQEDHEIATALQKQFLQEDFHERAKGLIYETKKNKTNNERTLVDPSWELIDPTPNIHNLFIAFNFQFFWEKLGAVSVSWSKRMTTCAGVCTYQGRGGLCSITLSEPLLKLRPRKDLVETLLHEMIHAYLFVTHNNRDRDGHGPEFHKHMYRINNEAGTNITVYHNFHDEVRLYQQHWWKCNGPCQYRSPYFGMIRRSTNRAPGPYDRWWDEHSRNCGGTFIKVKEPEKKAIKKSNEKENSKPKVNSKVTSPQSGQDIRKFFPTVGTSTPKATNEKIITNGNGKTVSKPKHDNTKIQNINGFKSGSCGSLELKNGGTEKQTVTISLFNGSGKVLAGNFKSLPSSSASSNNYSTVRNHWLTKFNNDNTNTKRKEPEFNKTPNKVPKRAKVDKVNCPVCNKQIASDHLNQHLDNCLAQPSTSTATASSSNIHLDETFSMIICDICDELIDNKEIETHKNQCLQNMSVQLDSSQGKECPICHSSLSELLYDSHVASCVIKGADNVITKLQDNRKENDNVFCLVCKKMIDRAELYKHLDECMSEEIFMTEQQKEELFDDSFDIQFDKTKSETGNNQEIDPGFVFCPVCQKGIEESLINSHLDQCLG